MNDYVVQEEIHLNSSMRPYDFWNSVVASALSYGNIDVPKVSRDGFVIPTPEESGLFRRSIGEMKGQIADWRATVPGSSRGVHAVEFEDHYSVHVDNFDPAKAPLKHLLLDSPKTIFSLFLTASVSMLLYGLFGRRR